jgi:hypothetical protein
MVSSEPQLDVILVSSKGKRSEKCMQMVGFVESELRGQVSRITYFQDRIRKKHRVCLCRKTSLSVRAFQRCLVFAFMNRHRGCKRPGKNKMDFLRSMQETTEQAHDLWSMGRQAVRRIIVKRRGSIQVLTFIPAVGLV